jgi:hypothetical protein
MKDLIKGYTIHLALILCICRSIVFAQVDKHHEAYAELDLWLRTAADEQIYLFMPVTKSLDDDYREAGVGVMYSSSYDQNTLALFDWLAARENYENFRHFTARAGLYYSQSLGDGGDAYREVSVLGEMHIRWLVWAGILMIDRNRFELRSINNDGSWRYRNRLTIERQFRLFDQVRFTPYTTLEASYDSRYKTFNRIRATAGSKFPFFSAFMFDLYYAYSNDTRSAIKNKHGAGLTLNFYIEPKDIFN